MLEAVALVAIGVVLGGLGTHFFGRLNDRRTHRKKMYEDVLPQATGLRAGKVTLEKAGQLYAQLQIQARLAGDRPEDRQHLQLILEAHSDAGIAEKRREGVALGLGETATPRVTMPEAEQQVELERGKLELRFHDYQLFCGKQLQGWRSHLRDWRRARAKRRHEREWAKRRREAT